MYEVTMRGPLNSFVQPADFNVMTDGPDFGPSKKKLPPITCKHKPRISKINGEWNVFDGFGTGFTEEIGWDNDGVTCLNFEAAVSYALSCIDVHSKEGCVDAN